MADTAHPLFLVLTAPSGAGKSTLVRMLREEFPAIVYSVSCTTRAPRGEEKDGVAYHFLTDEEFLRRVDAGEFLEHALVHGHYYGTLKSAVEGPLAEGRVLRDRRERRPRGGLRRAARRRPREDRWGRA